MSRPDHLTAGERLRLMLLGWGAVGLSYAATGYWPRSATVLGESALDRAIAYTPQAIWLYLAFFLLIPATYLAAPPQRVRWLSRAMPCTAVVCGSVFLLYPTALDDSAYPASTQAGWSGALLRLLLASDTARNCLPSLHAALTLLCVAAWQQRDRAWRSAAVLALGAGICLSIVQLRRHLFIDLTAGLLAGALGGALACWLQARRAVAAPLEDPHAP
jgi:membrane-associated phospholipid phosphatase